MSISSPPPPQFFNRNKSSDTSYCSVRREHYQLDITVERDFDSEDTKIMVEINLQRPNMGMSPFLLQEVINAAAEAAGLRDYKIFHSPTGLVLTGRP